MAKRIVIVGGVAAGASAAAKARRTSEDVQIVLVEVGPYVSFANCGLPYFVGGEIADRDDLFVVSAGMLRKRFHVDVRLNTRVTAVDRPAHTVTLSGPDGAAETLSYDRLILATGTVPIRPPIPGLDRADVFMVRTVPDVDAIVKHLATATPAARLTGEAQGEVPLHAAVIGGGYIGLETAEQLLRRGLSVTVIELADQLMPAALDAEMADPLREALEKAGATVLLGDALARIDDRNGRPVAITRSGREVPCDLGICGLGVKPNVALAKAAGIELGATGAIRVDRFQRTSDASVYAAGDNSETTHLVLNRPVSIPLAGPANKAGRAAGANAALDLAGAAQDDPRRLSLRGVLGTAIVRVCGVVAGATGLTEAAAKREGLDAAVMYMPGTNHAGYYPGAQKMLLKLLYARGTGRLLGAQAVGGEGVDKRIDVLATALTAGMSADDLEQLDLCYAPPFGSAKDIAVLGGFAAANERRGVMPTVTPRDLFDELEGDHPPMVLDVRSPQEYREGHLDEAVSMPLDDLRGRLDEVPRDRPVVLHCLGGYRSYCAQRILMNNGYANTRNITGGYALLKRCRALRTRKSGK